MTMTSLTTKEKILVAARQLFVEHGFAGTSIGNIAKLAGVNHSLIFHHFSNKEQLWVSVKLSIVAEASQQTQTLPETSLPFKQFLKKLFTENMRFYRENPDIIRMINWQRLESNAEQRIGITHSTEMQAWIAAFQYYQTEGDIDKKLKPEFIITLILAIISSSALDPNVFLHDEKSRQAYVDFCLQHLLKALGAVSKAGSS
jgi:AcrR family transcriptional regulator